MTVLQAGSHCFDNHAGVRAVHNSPVTQVSLSLSRFLTENVTAICAAMLRLFARPGYFEPFGNPFVCLRFRHNLTVTFSQKSKRRV